MPKRQAPDLSQSLGTLAQTIFATTNWGEVAKRLCEKYPTLKSVLAQPETMTLVSSALQMRDPIARVLVEQGIITAEEGEDLAFIPLLQRAVGAELQKRQKKTGNRR